MYLKSLTLKGFKSFADTTTLELEPGVTVVVGPNGSGKSNLVDAVAWVLGAQAPRGLRSAKMDDVVFAGTDRRPALGRAEVSLTIDNSSGTLPLDAVEVTLRRTLFRNGDSDYAVNGVACRLLDIQELLSDSGVGRTQHVIVGQGQLDAVLNAAPVDRRAVLEEAAGVLKFRRRKEKAERRLASTEANLVRLGDLLREVRRALRPLERQAEAARRHGDLVSELSGLRVHLAGREIVALRSRRAAAAATRSELATEERAAQTELNGLDTAVLATETELSARDGDDLGDALLRAERLGERTRGLVAVLSERRRGIERDLAASLDQGVVATLEADAAHLTQELADAEGEAAALVPDVNRLAEAEAALAAERGTVQAAESALGQTDGRAAAVRGELAAVGTALERARVESDRLDRRIEALAGRQARLEDETGQLRRVAAAAEAEEPSLRSASEEASGRRASCDEALAAAESALRSGEDDRVAWAARAETLAAALEQTRARAGAERLAGIEGVLGTLAEVVVVDDGWGPAFEAAAGAALAAVLIEGGPAAARRILALPGDDDGGRAAVLALTIARRPAVAPPVGNPVRPHVGSDHPGVDAVLDALLGGAVRVGGWEEAVDASAAHPDAVVVTADGDRFDGASWRRGAAGSGATAVAVEDAERRAAEAAARSAKLEAHLRLARVAVEAARQTEIDTGRALDVNRGGRSTSAAALGRIEAEVADLSAEREALLTQRDELADHGAAEQVRIAALEATLTDLGSAEAAASERVRTAQESRRRLEARVAAVGALRIDLEVRATGLEERRAYLRRRLADVDARLTRTGADRAGAAARREELEGRLLATRRLEADLGRCVSEVETLLGGLRERRRHQSEAARETSGRLDGLRTRRAGVARAMEELRERARRADLDAQETELRVEAATEAVRRDLGIEPDEAMAAPLPPVPEGSSPAARARQLEHELRSLGPVNPLALSELEELQERSAFLEGQLDDVQASRRELRKVIRAVDDEITGVFAAAFADVRENFALLFATLFPGGQGSLRLSDPDDLLGTGIEVDARPSGKNVRRLSLLSGGERSLTALAFLFAVFRSRPSPFYLLDEVEAALDDVNLSRFLDLVDEFRCEAQLLVVSHQKRTMEAADVLYGVTMKAGESSKVVSERVSVGAA